MKTTELAAYKSKKKRICIIGLGYVGLPLASLFARQFKVIGLDINIDRIKELRLGVDKTLELEPSQVLSPNLEFTTDAAVIARSQFIIVTVPTPIDGNKNPDLSPLIKASEMIGKNLSKGSTIVYESTVYPGCTEEVCIPLIEKNSGLIWKKDFNVGYSPERINPGDKEHTVDKIKKVVSGDSGRSLQLIYSLYGAVISAGVYQAESIATAEAAKVIENTQRDLNIALMNELSLIFARLGLNTLAVLEAAGTKWNFMPFRPGLVGGHCIGVDPYYLTFKAEGMGYLPQVILAGRRINDDMGRYVAEQTMKKLFISNCNLAKARVLILGWTFKENVPDTRNTKVVDIYNELRTYGITPSVYDPVADAHDVQREYGVKMIHGPADAGPYSVVIIAVKHKVFEAQFTLKKTIALGGKAPPIIMDIKSLFTQKALRESGVVYFQL